MIDIANVIASIWNLLYPIIIVSTFGYITKFFKSSKQRLDAISEGIKITLADRIYQAYKFHSAKGVISLDDSKHLETLYQQYKALGGNGTIEKMYKEIQELPFN